MKSVFQFVSTKGFGGLENMVINISTLVKGYNFTYVSPNGVVNSYLKRDGIKHINISSMNPISVRHVIKEYKPDIVQGHDVKASLALALNSHLCHKYGIKIISQIHNDDPRMRRYFGLRSLLYAISTPFYDNVIMISNPIFTNYVYKSFIRNKTTIIYNVINPKRIKEKLINGKINKKWDCIFVGRMVYQKNPLKFVKIIYDLRKKINNIKAVMIGTGPLISNVKKLISYYKLDKNIKLLGFKTNPYKYMQQSKIAVVTSVFEGFGLVALESLMIGLPVISTNVGGLSNIIDDNCGSFAKSSLNFSNKIANLLQNKELYIKKCKGAENRSYTINNIRNFSKLYRSVYNS